MIIFSFLVSLALFTVIGVLSYFKNKHNTSDYLLADQSVKPWLVALSGVATNNSGYMFIGMIGYTYAVGLSSIWLMIGWVAGDFLSSLYIHKKLRIKTEKHKALSYPEIISSWNGNNFKLLQKIGAIISIIFLGIYAAAQLKAGSKGLFVLFGWHESVGAVIGAIIVLLYCFAGGIRASIWTDAAQSMVMIVGMFLLIYFAINNTGGFESFYTQLNEVSPSYMSIIPDKSYFSSILFIMGWVFAGVGVIGQPHIMIRFMAMNKPNDLKKVRFFYYGWDILFYGLTISVGLAAKLILSQQEITDVELALPILAQKILPDILIGVVIAGLFAATMSTADSQILSCTASLSRDMGFKKRMTYFKTKLITVGITLFALFVALFGNENVFELVLISWSALASSFAPLLILLTLNKRPSETQSIIIMIVGLLTMLIWRYLGLSSFIYEAMPGILSGLIMYFVLIKLNAPMKEARLSILNNFK